LVSAAARAGSIAPGVVFAFFCLFAALTDDIGNASFGLEAFMQQQVMFFTFASSLFDLIIVCIVRGVLLSCMIWVLRVQPHLSILSVLSMVTLAASLAFGGVKAYYVFSAPVPVEASMLIHYLVMSGFFVTGIFYGFFLIKAAVGAASRIDESRYKQLPSLWEEKDDAASIPAPKLSINDGAAMQPVGEGDDAKAKEKEKLTVSFRRIAALALPEVPMLAFAMIMLLLSAAMLLVVPILFGLIIQAIRDGNNSTLMKSVVGLLIAAGGGGIVVLLRALGFQLAGQRVAARLRIDLYKSIIRQDVAFFDGERVGEIANRISTDTQVLQEAITTTFSQLMRNLVTVIGALVILFVTSWKLTLVMLAVVPVITVGAIVYGNFIKKLQAKYQDELAASVAIASESLGAIRTVRTFVRESRLQEDFR
jgi:hypothetical protein